MPVIEAKHLRKAFATVVAVDDVSFEVEQGALFGLLGPNGAGKTTTIRMLMDILRPDTGEVHVLGQAPSEARARVGYLPEERGLYRGLRLHECLTYFGELKGLSSADARRRATTWLERVELSDRAQAKVQELSRGMQQKVQIAATLIHDPELVILDEPFQGLDPVNVDLVRGIIRELHAKGTSVILCAHEMHLVETLCDRIALINKGTIVLNGELAGLKRQFAPNALEISPSAEVDGYAEVVSTQPRVGPNGRPASTLISLRADVSPRQFLKRLIEDGHPIERFEVASIGLDEIFVRVVKGQEVPA